MHINSDCTRYGWACAWNAKRIVCARCKAAKAKGFMKRCPASEAAVLFTERKVGRRG